MISEVKNPTTTTEYPATTGTYYFPPRNPYPYPCQDRCPYCGAPTYPKYQYWPTSGTNTFYV